MQFRKIIFVISTYVLLAFCPAAQAAYIDNGDGTVTDDGTGLMWQQGIVTDNYTWELALAYCDNLTLAGYTDWRLPTAKELTSLVDTTRFSPAINTAFYTTIPGAYYWSSTTDIYKTFFAWYMYTGTGYLAYGDKTDLGSVRAVRAGQTGSLVNLNLWPVPDTGQTLCYDNDIATACPPPGEAFFGQDASFSINTPLYTKLAAVCSALPDNATTWDMVRDEVTGLVWEEKHFMDSSEDYTDPNDADNTYTWYDNDNTRNGGNAGTPNDPDDTMSFIRDMNAAAYGGFTDWRIPTEKELQTIVDYGQKYPSINSLYFTNSLSEIYWSSTTSASDAVNAWSVYFNLGFVSFSDKSNHNYVRAVRGGQSGTLSTLLIVKSGTGTGTVVSTDGKIDCGSYCTKTYISCATVEFTATAASDSNFTGWSGGGCSGTGECFVTITDNMSVTANFDLIPVSTTTSAVSSTTTTDVSSTTTTDVSSTTTISPVSSTTTTDNSSTTTVSPVSSTTTTAVSSTTTVSPVSSTTTTDNSSTTTVSPVSSTTTTAVSSTTTILPVSSTTTTDNSSTTTILPVSSTTTILPVSSTTTTDNSSTTTILPVSSTTTANGLFTTTVLPVSSTTTINVSSTTTVSPVSSTTTTDNSSTTTVSPVSSTTTTLSPVSSTTTTGDNGTTTTVEPTTTTTAPACVDTDGDGYGVNCAAGPDCNDSDAFYNQICPDCQVGIFPNSLGRFLGDRLTTRRLLVIGKLGTAFSDTTPVRWETDKITVVSKRVLFLKSFMILKVSIDGAALGKGDYRVQIGDCSSVLTLVK